MTKEGAEKIKDALYLALSVISGQCTETDSCENCPLGYESPICCEDLFECVPDH